MITTTYGSVAQSERCKCGEVAIGQPRFIGGEWVRLCHNHHRALIPAGEVHKSYCSGQWKPRGVGTGNFECGCGQIRWSDSR